MKGKSQRMDIVTGIAGGKLSGILGAPFFLLTGRGGGEIRLNLTRIIEAVIIAVITASIIGWTVRGDIQRIEAKVDKMYADIYRPGIGVGK